LYPGNEIVHLNCIPANPSFFAKASLPHPKH